MSLFSRLKTDNQRILSSDMGNITLYNASGTFKTGQGRWTHIGLTITPQGQLTNTKKWSVAFHIDDFSDIMGANENFENWQAEFVNSQGETVRGVFNGQQVDKTLGYVSTLLTEIKT